MAKKLIPILIVLANRPKRRSLHRIRGRSRQMYQFTWTEISARKSVYAYRPQSQEEIDDLFLSHQHSTLSIILSDKDYAAPVAPDPKPAASDEKLEESLLDAAEKIVKADKKVAAGKKAAATKEADKQ